MKAVNQRDRHPLHTIDLFMTRLIRKDCHVKLFKHLTNMCCPGGLGSEILTDVHSREEYVVQRGGGSVPCCGTTHSAIAASLSITLKGQS